MKKNRYTYLEDLGFVKERKPEDRDAFTYTKRGERFDVALHFMRDCRRPTHIEIDACDKQLNLCVTCTCNKNMYEEMDADFVNSLKITLKNKFAEHFLTHLNAEI